MPTATDSRLPWRRIAVLALAFVVVGALNAALIEHGVHTGVPLSFPVSVFQGPRIAWRGVPLLVVFLVLPYVALKRRADPHALRVWTAAVLGLFVANLAQGGIDTAFLRPFRSSGMQYYHDAVAIESWSTWLASFGERQPELRVHSATHPPFAVLVHYWLLAASGGSLFVLSAAFVLAASLAVPLLYTTLRRLAVPRRRCLNIALLFAFTPAFNVYGAVSLDGVVLATATLALFGLVALARGGSRVLGVAALAAGVLATNALTFAGLFLFPVGVAVAWWERRTLGRHTTALALVAVAALGLAVVAALDVYFGYDHLAAFRTASRLENPDGFRGLAEPFVYVATRIESAAEWLLFASLATVAVLSTRASSRASRPAPLAASTGATLRLEHVVALASLATFAAMLATGAYRTGETARAALFMMPFALLALAGVRAALLVKLVHFAAVQTAVTQLVGSYFW